MTEYEPIKRPGPDDPAPRWCVTHSALHYKDELAIGSCDVRDLYVPKGCEATWWINPLDSSPDHVFRVHVRCNRNDDHDVHEGVYAPGDDGNTPLVSVVVRWADDA